MCRFFLWHSGSTNCVNTLSTWVSRYNYHNTQPAVDYGFQLLREKGIDRVYFNVWADGTIYANSETAMNNGKGTRLL